MVGLWQSGFSQIFIFGPLDFFADLSADLVLFVWGDKVPRKILQENLRQNPPKVILQKEATARGPAH